MSVDNLNFILALGVVAMQVGAFALLALFFMRKQPEFSGQVSFIARWALWKAFALAFIGSALTLVYSDILGFEPCPLCWWQRIFLYPQVILLGMALWRESYLRTAVDFSIVMSVIGAGIAVYHHLLQMMPAGTLPCPATGPSCAQITFLEFGYITYPMMALALFGLLIVLMLYVRSSPQSQLS